MPTVSVPAEFFRGELRVYANWREALCREVLQNSLDGGATRIDATFSTTEDGHGRVVFADNGRGMTRAVLENVFFALGKTTKTDTDAIGGFGRARIIICFAQHRYTIRTANLHVDGVGGQYTITQVSDYTPGCTFTIDLIDENPDRVRRELQWLVAASTIRIPVSIDGTAARPQTLPSRAARILRDTDGKPWARVYVSVGGAGGARVQVLGLPMFTKWVSTNDDIVVELEPSRAREVLAASRDQLHGVFAAQLDQLVADLAGNRRAALRESDQPLERRVAGGGLLASVPPAPEAPAEPSTPDSPAAARSGATPGDLPDAGLGGVSEGPRVAVASAESRARGIEHGLLAPETTPPAGTVASRPALPFDMFLLATAQDARTRRAVRAWDPASWTATSGTRRRQLLLTWKAAVAYMMDTLLALQPHLGATTWTVGWCFDDDVRATHRDMGGCHVLALNPVDAAGKAAYRPSAATDRRRLLALAAHEVAHVASSYHGEHFAGVLTDLYASVDPAAADRALRDAGR